MTIGGQQYDLKDAEARQSIADIQTSITGGMHYIGETSTVLTDGATTSTLVAKSENSLSKLTGFEAGDIVIYGELEFVWNGAKWQEFGSTGSLKSLAFKDNATGDVACAGTNSASAVTFSGGSTETVLKAVDDEAVAPSFTEGAFSAGELPSFTEGGFTPASLGTGFYTAGTAPSYSHSGFSGGSLGEASTGNFATAGVTASVDESNEIVTFAAASTASAVTAQGAFTPASYGTDSFSAGTPTAIDVTKFNGGSKAADTFSAGVLPSKAADTFSAGSAATFTTETVVKSIGTGTAAAQTFNGSTVSVTVA